MSSFSEMAPRKPARTLVIAPTAFADLWQTRPTANIAVGLRLLSEKDLETCTEEASKTTVAFIGGPDRQGDLRDENDIFNSHILAEIVSRTICDPNDVSKPHPAIPIPNMIVPTFMTPAGIRFVYDSYEQLVISTSPIVPEIDDASLALLVAHLVKGSLGLLSPIRARSIRKMLAAALEECAQAAPYVEAGDVTIDDGAQGEEDETDPPDYVITAST